MNPVTYTMLDLNGLDLASVRGQSYPGLYNSIYAAMNRCQEIILCNWFVASILIPPTYCLLEIDESNVISINNKVFIYPDDTIEIPDMGINPRILELSITQNGEYVVPVDYDGFNPVNVDVQPPLEEITITENGEYLPSEGYYGISKVISSIEVGVPILTREEWNALSLVQKRAYGLLAIQDASSGFDRGELVYGSDYVPGYYNISPDATSGPAGTTGTWTPSSGYSGYYTTENIPNAYFLLTYNTPFILGKIKYICSPINNSVWDQFLEYYDVNAQEWVEAYSTTTPTGTLNLELTIPNSPTVNAIRWRTTTTKVRPYNILIPTFGAMELR